MRQRLVRWIGTATASLLLAGCGRVEPIEEIAAENVEAVSGVASVTANPGDWPWWRGPGGDGIAADQDLPVTWSESDNVVWRAEVPGQGHSSPSVWGGHVYLTTAEAGREQQRLLCFDRASGELRWNTLIHEGGFMRKHGKNSFASGTPACDGQHVYAAFINNGALRVTACDTGGTIAWQAEAGSFRSEHGYGSSPALYKSLVIVLGDNLSGSFIAALDRSNGDVVWRTARETTGRHGSYATPIVAHVAGKDQLLVNGMGTTSSYDPATGKLLWQCSGPAEVTANTVAFSDEMVFSSGGYPESEIVAIRAGGSGDVSDTHVAWRAGRGRTYVPSPLYHDGRLYVVNDDGIATGFDAATGERLWQHRLQGPFSASPVLAGGHFYVTNEAGTTFVFKANPEFEVVAANRMGSGGFASLAIGGRQIYLRTAGELYCIGRRVEQTAMAD